MQSPTSRYRAIKARMQAISQEAGKLQKRLKRALDGDEEDGLLNDLAAALGELVDCSARTQHDPALPENEAVQLQHIAVALLEHALGMLGESADDLPQFDSAPVVGRSDKGSGLANLANLPPAAMASIMGSLLAMLPPERRTTAVLHDFQRDVGRVEPGDKLPYPSPHSNPLARFDPEYDASLGVATPGFHERMRQPSPGLLTRPKMTSPQQRLLTCIYEARCKMQTFEECRPSRGDLLLMGDKLVLAGSTGWKERYHALKIMDIDVTQSEKERDDNSIFVFKSDSEEGVAHGFYQRGWGLTPDPGHHQVWQVGEGGERAKAFNLDTRKCTYTVAAPAAGQLGPLLVVGEKLLSLGQDGMHSWDLATLTRHKDRHRRPKVFWEELSADKREQYINWEYVDEDVEDEVELSRGVKPDSFQPYNTSCFGLQRQDKKPYLGMTPTYAKLLSSAATPSPGGSSACGAGAQAVVACDRSDLLTPSCMALLDVEAAKYTQWMVGHYGPVSAVALCDRMPQQYLSASRDSTAKLWDVRSVKASLTLLGHSKPLLAAELAWCAGMPLAFTGGHDEVVKVWDLRVQQPLYELSAGNNSVMDLAWHEASASLIALTDCFYQDRMGYHHDTAPIRHWKRDPMALALQEGGMRRGGFFAGNEDDDYDGTDYDEEDEEEGSDMPALTDGTHASEKGLEVKDGEEEEEGEYDFDDDDEEDEDAEYEDDEEEYDEDEEEAVLDPVLAGLLAAHMHSDMTSEDELEEEEDDENDMGNSVHQEGDSNEEEEELPPLLPPDEGNDLAVETNSQGASQPATAAVADADAGADAACDIQLGLSTHPSKIGVVAEGTKAAAAVSMAAMTQPSLHSRPADALTAETAPAPAMELPAAEQEAALHDTQLPAGAVEAITAGPRPGPCWEAAHSLAFARLQQSLCAPSSKKAARAAGASQERSMDAAAEGVVDKSAMAVGEPPAAPTTTPPVAVPVSTSPPIAAEAGSSGDPAAEQAPSTSAPTQQPQPQQKKKPYYLSHNKKGRWHKQACHPPNYFRVPYNAAEHSLITYSFMWQPNESWNVPESGEVQPAGMMW